MSIAITQAQHQLLGTLAFGLAGWRLLRWSWKQGNKEQYEEE